MKKKKRRLIVIIIIAFLGTGLFFVSYFFYKAYKEIKIDKEKHGYTVSSKSLAAKVFTRGKWKGILLDADLRYTDGAHNIIPYDLDNDGQTELVANSYRSDTLLLYKYSGNPQDPMSWSRYVIDSSVGGGIPRKPVIKFVKSMLKENLLGGFTSGAHYTAIADMNGNGRYDLIVAGDMKRYDVVWYEAPEKITKISLWKKHIVYKNSSHRTYQVEAGYIDSDKNQDLVFAAKTDNSLGWLKNNGPSKEWISTWLSNYCLRCFYARAADINKDGHDEIIASEDDLIRGGKLHIYSYSDNPMLPENWIDHIVAGFPAGHGVSIFEIIDIDNDGDLDIVTGNHQGEIYIVENPLPAKIYGEWKKYKINNYGINSGHDFREMDVGDIDNDGDLDVTAADENKNMVIWFENSSTTSSENWREHIVDKSDQYLKWCHSVELGDIDGDGDLDIAVAAAGSNTFLIYFNNLRKKEL